MLGQLVNHAKKKDAILISHPKIKLGRKKSVCEKQNFKVLAVNVGQVCNSWKDLYIYKDFFSRTHEKA